MKIETKRGREKLKKVIIESSSEEEEMESSSSSEEEVVRRKRKVRYRRTHSFLVIRMSYSNKKQHSKKTLPNSNIKKIERNYHRNSSKPED